MVKNSNLHGGLELRDLLEQALQKRAAPDGAARFVFAGGVELLEYRPTDQRRL